jgi:hypothetical protein
MISLPLSMPRPVLVCLSIVVAIGATVLAGEASMALVSGIGLSGTGLSLVRDLVNLALVLAVGFVWMRLFLMAATPAPTPVTGRIGPGFGMGAAWGIGPLVLAWMAVGMMGAVSLGTDPVGPVTLIVPLIMLPAHLAHGLAEQVLLQVIAQRAVMAGAVPGALSPVRQLAGAMLAGICLAGVQALQGYASPIELLNSFLLGTLLGVVALGSGGILAAGIAHGLWTWAERLVIGDIVGAQVIATDPPTYLAGPGPDTYTSEAFSLCLVVAITLAIILLQRSKRHVLLQADDQQG